MIFYLKLGPLLEQGLRLLRQWRHRARSRRQLLALDEQRLKDTGLSRAEALREGCKPFWQS
ncbi:DUF1127 domain-containing protein [Marinobacterium arenosum]|uniref:DUF1127 domain-containing protein n=1 Tax=Marinobacterium arenosum TaxID=2862496 RepID=UPI001C949093|nr:DUF1127 domain-containing protein [Marinobacterium arenosum]MBY4675483.1 DUF1127 domain-containing protein [Marinobacterium arenosum]